MPNKPNYETSTHFGTSGSTRLPRQPPSDIVEKQDRSHSEADFLRDLNKATQEKPQSS